MEESVSGLPPDGEHWLHSPSVTQHGAPITEMEDDDDAVDGDGNPNKIARFQKSEYYFAVTLLAF